MLAVDQQAAFAVPSLTLSGACYVLCQEGLRQVQHQPGFSPCEPSAPRTCLALHSIAQPGVALLAKSRVEKGTVQTGDVEL
jgi:hypothetical protein